MCHPLTVSLVTTVPLPHAWPQPFVLPGSLHSGHSSARPPRSPRLMGIHGGSSPSPWHPRCRQEPPALFPAFAAKRLPARGECPVLASAGPLPALTALGGLQWGRGAICPPTAPVPHGGAGTAQARDWGGAGCPHPTAGDGHPLCGSIFRCSPSKWGGSRECLHPTGE